MRRGLLITLVLVAVLAMSLFGWAVGARNDMNRMSKSVDQSWAQVDNQLQRRNDLIGNLVETVKGIAAQEQEVFGAIADARARMSGARSPEEAIEADRQMTSALGRLLVVVENYPQLRSSENFLSLQDEISGTENRIATERGRYNQQVQTFNTKVTTFPDNMVAGFTGFSERTYYEIPEAAREVPKVDFSGIRQGGEPAGEASTGK